MARSIWKGDISFGLVSIPVSLVSTEENNDIHFHLLNAKTIGIGSPSMQGFIGKWFLLELGFG